MEEHWSGLHLPVQSPVSMLRRWEALGCRVGGPTAPSGRSCPLRLILLATCTGTTPSTVSSNHHQNWHQISYWAAAAPFCIHLGLCC